MGQTCQVSFPYQHAEKAKHNRNQNLIQVTVTSPFPRLVFQFSSMIYLGYDTVKSQSSESRSCTSSDIGDSKLPAMEKKSAITQVKIITERLPCSNDFIPTPISVVCDCILSLVCPLPENHCSWVPECIPKYNEIILASLPQKSENN